MIEDMTIRKFAQKTQHDYVQRVKDFANYLKRSPDTAKPDDVRGFQVHLTSSGAGVPKINSTISALRFFFRVTLDRPDLSRHLSTIHKPRSAPVILSPDEVARFLEAAPGIKYKAAFSVAYGAGLRVSELTAMLRTQVRFTPAHCISFFGKGRKVRVVPLMDATARILREHMCERGLDHPGHGLEPLFQNRLGERLSRHGSQVWLVNTATGELVL